MPLTVFLAVILAAFLHATWNAMVKNEKDKYLGVAAIVFGRVPASIVIIFLNQKYLSILIKSLYSMN